LFCVLYTGIHTDVFTNFLSVVRPFINGFILAYLSDILLSRLETKFTFKGYRFLCILLVYMTVIGVIVLLAVYIAPIVMKNLQYLLGQLPFYFSRIPTQREVLNTAAILDFTSRFSTELLQVTDYARQATEGVINGVLAVVISIYVLLSKEGLCHFCSRLCELIMPNQKVRIQALLQKSHRVFCQFLVAQLLASGLLGVVAGIVLSLIGVNYGILIGAIVGVLNIIPLFGAIIGVVVATGIMFLSNGTLLAWAGFAFLLFLQQLDATVITPKLMGNVLRINPLVVLFAMIVGTAYFGLPGILFAVPITVVVMDLVQELL